MLWDVSDLATLAVLFPWNQSDVNKAHFLGYFASI